MYLQFESIEKSDDEATTNWRVKRKERSVEQIKVEGFVTANPPEYVVGWLDREREREMGLDFDI